MRIDADIRDLIVCILHHSDRKDYIHFVKEHFCRLRDVLCKSIKPAPVQSTASAVLGQADRHHLEQTALMFSFKIRVRLHLVVDNDPVCFRRQPVAADRCAGPVVQLSDLNDVHAGADRYAEIFLCDPVSGEDFQIAFRCAAAVAPHSRDNERIGSPFLQLIADRPHNDCVVGNASAADGYGYALSLHKRPIVVPG